MSLSRLRRFRPSLEKFETRTVPAVFTVTNTLDSGPGSFRQAVGDSYGAGADTIDFNIPNTDPGFVAGIYSINMLSGVAFSTGTGYSADDTVLDATTQPGWAVGSPVIELNGALAGGGDTAIGFYGNDGLQSTGVTVKGLIINRWGGSGFNNYNSKNITIQGCWVGLDSTGTVLAGNGAGVNINALAGVGTSGVLIGGPNLADRNVIVDNHSQAMYVDNATNCIIQNNFIGTDKTGTLDLTTNLGFNCGIQFGGGAAGFVIRDNLMSGFAFAAIASFNGASNMTLVGNKFGTDATGMLAIPNSPYGVLVGGTSSGWTIGGTTVADRNIFSGNSDTSLGYGAGLELQNTASNIKVYGNYVGVAADGVTPLPNGFHGIETYATGAGVEIGGSLQGQGNLVLHNGSSYGQGIQLGGQNTVVRGNVVGKNTSAGIAFNGGSNNIVVGNYIGVTPAGVAIPNNGAGVDFFANGANESNNNKLGGTTAGEGNVISGNNGVGVSVGGMAPVGNQIRGNSIFNNNGGGINSGLATGVVTLFSTVSGASIAVAGSLTGLPSTVYNVDFFENAIGGVHGQGYIGSVAVTTDAAGLAPISATGLGFAVAGGNITATASEATGNTSTFSAPLAALGTSVVPAKVTGISVNNGAAQRSQVTSIKVTFDQIVGFVIPPVNPTVFSLTRQSDGAVVQLAASVDNTGPGTVVTLTFTGGAVTPVGGSLLNGRYTLSLDALMAGNSNGYIDGNGDGTGGDNYTLVGSPTAGTPKLFRFYGDADGDGDVDNSDFVAFRNAFGNGPSIFDADGDGDTDNADFVVFRAAFGTMV